MAYDAAKAAEYNKLIQQGLSEDQAFKQAGISDADLGNYQINLNGTLGPINLGQNKVAGVDYDVGTGTGETVNTRVTTYSSYTSTSTEQVSGGGSTTIVANRTVPTAASEAYASQANAKQAEIDQFIKDNPSNFARKKQGLPPLSDQEIIARQTQLDALNSERAQLYNTSLDSRSSTPPTVYTEPNTTTTTETVTTGVAYSRESVNYNNDESLSQKTELQLETTTTTVNSQSATDTSGDSAGYGSSYETDERGTPLPTTASGGDSAGYGSSYETDELGSPLPVYSNTGIDYASGQGGTDGVDFAYTESAAAFSDPYYGLTPEQLKALGGADPTDPYIRARLGIPQLPDSTLNPGGFAAYRPTGVPLIDNAVAAISSFASSLTSFFSPPTKPAVTAAGTTTGAPAPAGTNTATAAAEATAVKQQNTDLTPAQQANLDNIQAANAEVSKAEENIQANNRTILAAEEGVATARETQRNAEAIIAQNNAELADENLPDDRRAQLEANNAEQYASIAENARYIDETTAAIENAEQNNQQQQRFIQENQTSVEQSQQAFAADNSDLDAPVDPMEDPEYNNYDTPEYDAATDGPATAQPGEPGGAPLLTDAEIAQIYGTTDPQETNAIQGTAIISDEARAALSDPETIKAQQAQNQFVLENPATVPDVTTTELTDAEAANLFDEAEAGPPTEDEGVEAGQDIDLQRLDDADTLAETNAQLEADPIELSSDPDLQAQEDARATDEANAQLEADPIELSRDPYLQQLDDADATAEANAQLEADPIDLEEQDPGEAERLAAEERLDESPTLNAEDVELGEEERLAAEAALDDSPTLNAEDVDESQDAALGGELTTADGEVEGEGDAGTGLQEPTEEDVRAAEEAAAKERTINQATLQSRYKQPGNTDWRVRLALAPTSDYLYNSDDNSILAPLAASNGVIFPYMPQISTAYRANYENYDLVHSNFRGVYYKSSRVDDIQVRGTFTAQDTTEAKYLLAVIHFFRSVTKMFYGKDVERGTPPPLVYLSGLGDYQFSKHPCLVSQFSYTLPNDVDYIRATNPNDYGGNLLNRRTPVQAAPGGINFAGARRLANAITPSGQPLSKGATPQTPSSNSIDGRVNNTGDFSTYVPTMMEIDITLIPVQTRSQVSKQFSLKDFANGNLLKGGFW